MEIPYTPGVYFFKSEDGAIIYIGKAKNLRNRLRNHHMLKKSSKLEWQETESEIEALILEARWIKKYKPKYNIALRDDKNYVYVTFTHDDLPKVFITHRGGIGPFTDAGAIRALLKLLRKLFPYCTCKQKHNRPCLNANLGLCLGICCLANSKSETLNTKQITKQYKENIKQIKAILTGRKRAALGQRMFQNIKAIREIAGRENALVELQKRFNLFVFPHRIEGYDISNIQGKFATGSMVVFENGYPNKNEYRKFKIKAPASPDDTLMLQEMLGRRFAHKDWPRPDLILIDGGKAQLSTIAHCIIKRFLVR